MEYKFLRIEKKNKITWLILNRPDKRNALNRVLMSEISAALQTENSSDSRVVIIKGAGDNFCAGADLTWMQQADKLSQEENKKDANTLAELLFQLYEFPKPTIALVHGAVLGGGIGLCAAADIRIASPDATFAFPEVRLGLIPAIISPFVISAIGKANANYYFLTGEKFGGEKAHSIGLIHQITTKDKLSALGEEIANKLLQACPKALSATKKLISSIDPDRLDKTMMLDLADVLAQIRVTPEAQEGLKAFLEKRAPNWSEV